MTGIVNETFLWYITLPQKAECDRDASVQLHKKRRQHMQAHSVDHEKHMMSVRAATVFIIGFIACHVCEKSHVTEVVDRNSDRKILGCDMNVNQATKTVLWSIMYEDGIQEFYTCPEMKHGVIADCSSNSTTRRKKVECSCVHNVKFSIYVILHETATSIHRCLINNGTTVLREFFVIPETFIYTEYVGFTIRKIICCVISGIAVTNINITRDGSIEHYSEQLCHDKRCAVSTSKISDNEFLTRYACDVSITMWNMTVSTRHSATIVRSSIAYIGRTVQYRHSGACGGSVTWLHEVHGGTAKQCDYANIWFTYKSRHNETFRTRNGESMLVDSGQCKNGMSEISVEIKVIETDYRTAACIFGEGNDIFVYETHFIKLLELQLYKRDGHAYLQCVDGYQPDTQFGTIVLSGCNGSIVHGQNMAIARDPHRGKDACITVEYGCDCGAVWLIRNRTINGPKAIDNVTSYVLRNEHCVDDGLSCAYLVETSMSILMIIALHLYVQTFN